MTYSIPNLRTNKNTFSYNLFRIFFIERRREVFFFFFQFHFPTQKLDLLWPFLKQGHCVKNYHLTILTNAMINFVLMLEKGSLWFSALDCFKSSPYGPARVQQGCNPPKNGKLNAKNTKVFNGFVCLHFISFPGDTQCHLLSIRSGGIVDGIKTF